MIMIMDLINFVGSDAFRHFSTSIKRGRYRYMHTLPKVVYQGVWVRWALVEILTVIGHKKPGHHHSFWQHSACIFNMWFWWFIELLSKLVKYKDTRHGMLDIRHYFNGCASGFMGPVNFSEIPRRIWGEEADFPTNGGEHWNFLVGKPGSSLLFAIVAAAFFYSVWL